VPVTIENICPDFITFWQAAKSQPLEDQIRLWRELYEEPHRDIFEIYYRHWGLPSQITSALARFPQFIPALPSYLRGLDDKIPAIADQCKELFSVNEFDLNFVIMVGTFSSDGWTTTYHDKSTIFLSLEYITGPPYIEILAAHEASHGFHFLCTPEKLWTDFAVGEASFLEGLAILASTFVCPRRNEIDYLTFGKAGEAWLAECIAGWPDIRLRFSKELEKTDRDIYQAFFAGGAGDGDIPKRSGYYLGYRLVKRLAQNYSIDELARWSPPRASRELKRLLEQQSTM
jgi:uncharacterized protein YjaZ